MCKSQRPLADPLQPGVTSKVGTQGTTNPSNISTVPALLGPAPGPDTKFQHLHLQASWIFFPLTKQKRKAIYLKKKKKKSLAEILETVSFLMSCLLSLLPSPQTLCT